MLTIVIMISSHFSWMVAGYEPGSHSASSMKILLSGDMGCHKGSVRWWLQAYATLLVIRSYWASNQCKHCAYSLHIWMLVRLCKVSCVRSNPRHPLQRHRSIPQNHLAHTSYCVVIYLYTITFFKTSFLQISMGL